MAHDNLRYGESDVCFAQPGYEELIARLLAGDGKAVATYRSQEATVQAVDVTHDGRGLALIVRTPKEAGMEEADPRLSARARALCLHLGHEALEQVLVCGLNIVITERMEGELTGLPIEQVEDIKLYDLERLAIAIERACAGKPLAIDTRGPNILWDGGGLAIIDYAAPESGAEPAGQQFRRIVRERLQWEHLGAASERSREAWKRVYELGMHVLRMRYPDQYAQVMYYDQMRSKDMR